MRFGKRLANSLRPRADATTGLDDFNARYYDPAIGQFAQADLVLDGLNRYRYVGGNPETFADPSGLMVANDPDRSIARMPIAVEEAPIGTGIGLLSLLAGSLLVPVTQPSVWNGSHVTSHVYRYGGSSLSGTYTRWTDPIIAAGGRAAASSLSAQRAQNNFATNSSWRLRQGWRWRQEAHR